MHKLMEWLAKFAFDRILGAIVSSLGLVAILNAALRQWTALPGYWRWAAVLSTFAVVYNLFVRFGPRWRLVATTADGEALDLIVTAGYENGTCRLTITNRGQTDTFATEVKYLTGVSQAVWPCSLRWRGTEQETREIVRGHTHFLEAIRVEHVKAPERTPEGRFTIGSIQLLTPAAELPLSVTWGTRANKIASLGVNFQITSSRTGARQDCTLRVFVATDGHSPPVCETVLERQG